MKITKELFLKASEKSGGNMSVIAERLGVTRSAICHYCERNPWAKQVIIQEDDKVDDLAENQLMKKILEGNMKAITFRLETKGSHRGYVTKQKVEHTGDVGLIIDDINKAYKDD